MSFYDDKTKKLIALLTLSKPFDNRYIPVDTVNRYVNIEK